MTVQRWFTSPAGIIISSVAATMLWGSALPFIKLSYHHLHIGSNDLFAQWLFAGYRFVLAGLLLMVLARLLQRKGITPSRVPISALTVLALLQTFLQYVFVYAALGQGSGMTMSIISGSVSLFQLLAVRWMMKTEQLSVRKWLGLLLGFGGIAVMGMASGNQLHITFGLAELLMLLSALSGGVGNVLARREAAVEPVISLTGRQMFWGGMGLVMIGCASGNPFPFVWDGIGLLMLLYLSLLSAGAFALWNTVMKYNEVGRVSMYLFLTPPFGVILSAVWLGERASLWSLVALALVTASIVLVNRGGRAAQSTTGERSAHKQV
ncbi:DMT family transporter [Paenibacillus campi]|uniref:DMT family transporter n=1 Tax=Paenibacillus campi TaxID=3106031 RepID=UPI002AFF0BEE|nr:DMT family transporter [Paenibacillus sp. SGZ-1009]